MSEPLRIQPDPRLTRRVRGLDQAGAAIDMAIAVERPPRLPLCGQEIMAMMTILDGDVRMAGQTDFETKRKKKTSPEEVIILCAERGRGSRP